MKRILLLLFVFTSPVMGQDFGEPMLDEPAPARNGSNVPLPDQFNVFGGTPTASQKVKVLDPDGKAVSDAIAWIYPGHAMSIGPLDDDSQDGNVPAVISQSPHTPGTPFQQQKKHKALRMKGETLSIPAGQSCFVWHESGYRLATDRDTRDAEIKLAPWCSSTGRVTVNGQPIENGFVQASWESFPHHPSLTNRPNVAEAPALVSMVRRTKIMEDGTYNFTQLPAGRIHFMVFIGAEPNSMTAQGTNLTWWESTSIAPQEPQGLSLESPGQHDFKATQVTGSIDLTEALYRSRVTIDRSGGQVEVKQKNIILTFCRIPDAKNQPTINRGVVINPIQSLDESLKEAVVWGRPGGRREAANMCCSTQVSDDGDFTCLLQPGNYNVLLMTRAGGSNEIAIYSDSGTVASIDKEDLDGDTYDMGVLNVDEALRSVGQLQVPESHDRFDNFAPIDALREDRDDQFEDSVRFKDPRTNDFQAIERPNRSEDMFGPEKVEDRFPIQPDEAPSEADWRPDPRPRVPTQPPTVSPPANKFDQAIAAVVTKLLSANDRRVRVNLEPELRQLLTEKFDAEQKAREAIITELTTRLRAAQLQVEKRKTDRDRIINDQLKRMMGLPEDEFLLPEEPAEQLGGGDSDLFGKRESEKFFRLDSDSPRPRGNRAEEGAFLLAPERTENPQAAFNESVKLPGPNTSQVEFELVAVNGTNVSSKQLIARGQVFLMVAWGTWCPPCTEELPDLVALKKKYGKFGFEIVGLNSERGPSFEENYRTVTQYVRQHQINFPTCIVEKMKLESLVGYPTHLLVNSDGIVTEVMTVLHTLEILSVKVETLLKERQQKSLQLQPADEPAEIAEEEPASS